MVLSTLQTIALIVGIVYYITIMRNQQKTRELALKAQEQATETRQTQIFLRLFEQINNVETQTQWAELVNMEIDNEEYLMKYDSYFARARPSPYQKSQTRNDDDEKHPPPPEKSTYTKIDGDRGGYELSTSGYEPILMSPRNRHWRANYR